VFFLHVAASTGKTVRVYTEKDPEKIKWKELQVEYVIDSTGKFTEVDTAEVIIAMKYVLRGMFLYLFK